MGVLFIFLTILLLIAFVAILCSRIGVPDTKKWPPITEDEFIRRCPPGVDRERALRVRRIIAEQLGVDYERVYPEQRFVEDLGCD